MTSTLTAGAPPVLTPGLIASLKPRLWLDHTPGGEVFTVLLLTFPAPQLQDADPAEVEQTMLGVAASVGGPAPRRRRWARADCWLWCERIDVPTLALGTVERGGQEAPARMRLVHPAP